MKKIVWAMLITIICLSAKEIKTGFVDSGRIFKEYQATAAANIELNDYIKTYRDSAAVLKQKIEAIKQELDDQKLMLSEEARLRKLDDIETFTKIYNHFLEEVFGDGGKIEQKNDELMAPLLKKVNETVEKIALQEAFAVVFDLSENVMYASSELDLTDLVINELNLEYGPQTLPTGEMKKTLCIFPFREENNEAANADLGQFCQNELYKIVSIFSKFDFISKTSVNSEIFNRGFGLKTIDENQARQVKYFTVNE